VCLIGTALTFYPCVPPEKKALIIIIIIIIIDVTEHVITLWSSQVIVTRCEGKDKGTLVNSNLRN
jgi:hypothetical protein